MLAQRRAGHTNRRENGTKRHRGGALNVVIESEHLIAVTIENRTRVDAGKVFPLQKRSGKNFLDGGDEGIDEAVVLRAADARLAPAKIFRIAKTFFVVRADIEDDRKSARGMNSTDETVERKLADGNAEAANALVADAEDTLSVGNDDDVYFRSSDDCAEALEWNVEADKK